MELPDLDPISGLGRKSYIALQPYSGFARNPTQRIRFVQSLVDLCHELLPHLSIICVGHPSTSRDLSGVNYDHLSPPLGMLRVIQHAALVLTPRSASAHISAAYRIPSFLWLPDDGENWHLDYPDWTTRQIGIESAPAAARESLTSLLGDLGLTDLSSEGNRSPASS